jgi:[FeFe] hydrogenase (group B1/B3)
MNYDNNAVRLHREVLIRVCESLLSDDVGRQIDRLPLAMRPRGGPATRCCVYRDRALIKYRVMAALGFPVEEEADELTPLSEYARRASEVETKPPANRRLLSVLSDACAGCEADHYFVTDACHGCLARPCMVNCPKSAIQIVAGHARIDPSLCVKCGKCTKVCPYHAIVYVPQPCEDACPVNAISRSDDGKQQIDERRCIHCGKCRKACPFGAVLEVSELARVIRLLHGSKQTVALAAPALAGQFNAKFGQIVAALRKVGFDEVVEVAAGADQVAALEAAEFVERRAEGLPILTSSCCPAWACAAKTIPAVADCVSKTPSPMRLAAEEAKRRWPDAATVFISPCIAKRAEAATDDAVDAVLNFEELGAILVAWGVEVESLEASAADCPGGREGRGFAKAGGVAAAIARHVPPDVPFVPKLVQGLDRKTIKSLGLLPRTADGANYFEVMSCEEGCVGGPSVLCNALLAGRRVAEVVAETDDGKKAPGDSNGQ